MSINRYYKPELDVLRFCAFLFVFFVHRLDLAPVDTDKYFWEYHLSLLGNYGVPLFFFLSSFLITELLQRENMHFGKIDIKSFYIRRILRIWPLYFTFFFVMVLLTHTTNAFSSAIPPKAQLAFTFFAGNWYITFNEWQSYCINPLWSVSVEEQLYILLPLIMLFTGKKGTIAFSILSILVAYIAIVYYAQKPTDGFNGQWTNSFVQFQFFAAGILLAIFLKGRMPKWNAAVRIGLFAAGIVCWLIASMVCEVTADAPHLNTVTQSVSGWLLILIGVTSMFLSLYGASSKHMPQVLVYLGRISYGMYIFHITIYWITYTIFKNELAALSKTLGLADWQNTIGFIIAFITTVMLASLSYRYFEKLFLKLKKRYTLIPSRD
ncbi:peptidoglycan/LPS O-acetylase OafA/YrhL [Pedobacter sp. AK013]|uniref:acyltransferase family protein n=1 Tax=Pedobacter sp. AK013 TaxID=2723071 RepID=UPI00160A7EFC|nr:acyltransferase [Pedobacter sp. AK013]MBB6240232.1 peptidoglycan/LPS O-acetylase OafA/YrhL [Pedobacter sp. AK013]